ncbi:phosphonate metabolism protein/1,5-bisphosphokinase (PRPP-forming) PhnN [Aquibium carbonis]|uniref:Ribose 1,5-bisphosphate phosphokinase PhnN n=1 Tax=Aquibium carbonis TaxID=2495581 RepID=A0A3R9YAG0_9HYPH|nr:phosphonate metabolism protein/1,5-bisphosphokinase (PRPP-forming) PhnN [Aquibium carbonis]RST86801.1 phosphonate metabolism protein/1,5-bisphosphokinase (PRPP-forming) PhnN [Aquibium carbonis]
METQLEVKPRSRDQRERQGAFVAIVGPSGVGKDTLIAYAKARLGADERAPVHFVRRVITRAADGSTEDHDSLSPEAFEHARAGGAFSLSWDAHGLHYGLPASVDRQIAAGHTVVANLSRAALPALKVRYRHVLVVAITASPETLAKRLMARGRESADEVSARLARAAAGADGVSGAVTSIVNDGPIEQAGEALVAAIRSAGEMAAAPVDL